MRKKFKNRLGLLAIDAGIFLFLFLAAFFLLFTFLYIFTRFGLLSATWTLLIALIASFVIAVTIFCYLLVRIKKQNVTKLSYWLALHLPKIILADIFLNIFFVSIRAELIWDYNSLKDVLTIVWTIFGLSLAIFLVWNVLIVEYVKNKEPKQPTDDSFKSKYKFLQGKMDFHQEAASIFGNVILLFVNLIAAIFATVSVYVVARDINLFSQTLVLLGFYLSTNTLVCLFLDMLRPIFESKRKILKENKVDENELRIAYLQAKVQTRIEEIHKVIYANDKLTQEDKDLLFTSIIEEVKQNLTDTSDKKE